MTEFVITGSHGQLSKIHINSITVGTQTLNQLRMPKIWVLGLASTWQWTFTLVTFVKTCLSRSLQHQTNHNTSIYYGYQNINSCLVTAHLGYCNSLLPKYQLNRLQKILNAAARVICLVSKFCYVLHDVKIFTCP